MQVHVVLDSGDLARNLLGVVLHIPMHTCLQNTQDSVFPGGVANTLAGCFSLSASVCVAATRTEQNEVFPSFFGLFLEYFDRVNIFFD